MIISEYLNDGRGHRLSFIPQILYV